MKLSSGSLLFIIIAFSALTKLIYVSSFTDLHNINYYEYGQLAKNMCGGNGYSMRHPSHWNENDLTHSEIIYKSAYMSPGYAFFLCPFFLIENEYIRNLAVIFVQILISCLLLMVLFDLSKKIFSRFTAFLTIIIAGFLPEFIYSATNIQTTLFYQLGITVLLFFLYKINDDINNKKIIIAIGVISGLMVLIRSEMILFLLIVVAYLVVKKNLKLSLTIAAIAFLIFLPWQIRNYSTFGEIVPFTTSGGLNFYRGHNPYAVGVWGDSLIFNKLSDLRKEENFEVLANKFYFESAVISITNNPVKELTYPFIKLYYLWIISPYDTRSYNLFYLVPWVLLLPLFIYGLIKSANLKKHKFAYLFLIYFSLIAILFFVLPRYQTIMKILLIPFAAYSIELIWKKFLPKNSI